MAIDWLEMASRFEYGHMYQLVILPFYEESVEVVDATLQSLADVRYDKKSIIIVLAAEAR